jgi:hypothetical protein
MTHLRHIFPQHKQFHLVLGFWPAVDVPFAVTIVGIIIIIVVAIKARPAIKNTNLNMRQLMHR